MSSYILSINLSISVLSNSVIFRFDTFLTQTLNGDVDTDCEFRPIKLKSCLKLSLLNHESHSSTNK